MSSTRFTRSRLPGRPTRTGGGFQGQNYDDIVRKCKKEGILFEDKEFPATDESAFFSKQPPRPLEWKRPKEICDNPQFKAGEASRFDVQQGMMSDSWLLAALASLTCNQRLLDRVVVPGQSFADRGYVGCFRFNFWNQGEWQEVVVDDRLPTYNNKLVFMHSADGNEFWSALLEKAYAKLHGSYEALKAGSASEGMEDFTGGVTENFDLSKADSDLLTIMLNAFARSSLMCCCIDAKPNEVESKLDNGLVMGLAYSVTAVKNVEINASGVQRQIALVRVRNPWGNEREWTGPWSDKSQEWSLLSEDERKDIGLTFEDDGEFWMSFDDWKNNFNKVEICNLSPDSLSARDKMNWAATYHEGEWVRGSTAGGCKNYINTFACNPQFRVVLKDSDDEDDLCTLVVALLQKDRRRLLSTGKERLTIGYTIYKAETEGLSGSRLDTDFFTHNSSVAKSPTFINAREVVGRHKLAPGTYVIVPSTFDPGHEGTFFLRMFSEKPRESSEMDLETRIVPDRKVPPPSEEDDALANKMAQLFSKIAGIDGEIDAYELQRILNAAFKSDLQTGGFSIDVCSSIIAGLDGDMTGKLCLQEFVQLWKNLMEWKAEFTKFDTDKSGNMDSYELRQALRSCGFMLSNQALSSIILRYSSKDGKISFEGFIYCIVRLKTMIGSFSAIAQNGSATYDLDTFIQTTMYS